MGNAFPTHPRVCPLTVPPAPSAAGRLWELLRSAEMATTHSVLTTQARARDTAACDGGSQTNGYLGQPRLRGVLLAPALLLN